MQEDDPRAGVPDRSALLLLGVMLVATAATRADDIFVDTYEDDFTANGNCTLREAIWAANNDSDVNADGCDAGSGSDRIIVPPGRIQLAVAGSHENFGFDGDLDVRAEVEIIGAGADATIVDGGGIERVFHVDPSGNRTFTVEIRGMTLQNGVADSLGGGGVFNNGVLSLYDVRIVDNTALDDAAGGGVFNNYSLTAVLSEIAGNRAGDGGGLFAEGGSLGTEIVGTTVRDNVAVNTGGGMQINDKFRVSFSTISGNEAGLRGGGVVTAAFADGSGFVHTTISGNTAIAERGGGVLNNGTLQIYGSTIVDNDAPEGGGLHHSPVNGGLNVYIGLSILATNEGGNCAGAEVRSWDFDSGAGAYNLEDADSCDFNGGSDQTSLIGTDPQLATLGDNGGPTPTHAPRTGSPVIDAVDAADLAICESVVIDQRGAPRIAAGTEGVAAVCDIGALEVNRTLVVDTETDAVDLAPGDGVCDTGNGDCSLRAAIQEANAGGYGIEFIVLPAGTFTLSIAGTEEEEGASGDLDILDYLVIEGAGMGETIIDGNGLDRVFDARDVMPNNIFLRPDLYPLLELRGLGIQNGSTNAAGGGIRSLLSTALERVAVSDNEAGGGGGGISCEADCALRIIDNLIENNRSNGGHGGGVRALASGEYLSVLLERTTFRGNSAVHPDGTDGGAITLSGRLARLRNATVSGNEANFGGGLDVDDFQVTGVPVLIEDSTFSDNTADSAGAIYGSGVVVLRRVLVAGNAVSDPQNAGEENCVGDRIRSLGHNLEDRNQCNLDLALNDQSNVDPLLEPVSDNGGPTPTHALMAGSPAIDTGGTECADTDQRGIARPLDGDLDGVAACDIGAYEYQAPADLLVTATDAPDPVTVGDDVTYTITVTNDGLGGASGVTLTATVPPNASLVSATISQGNCNASATSVDCELGSIAAGESVNVTVVVTASTAGTLDGSIAVSAEEPDPNAGNNRIDVMTSVNSAGGGGGGSGSGGGTNPGSGGSGPVGLLTLLALLACCLPRRRTRT